MMHVSQKKLAKWFNPFVYIGCGIVAFFSLISFVVSWIDFLWRIQIFPWPLMKLSSALGLLGCSLGIILERMEWRKAAAIIGLFIGGGALLFVLRSYQGTGFDDFFSFLPTQNVVFWGRSGLNTTFCFMVCGFALWINNYWVIRQSRPFIVGVAGSFIVAVALVAFIGRVGGIETAYRWDGVNGMSLSTSISLIVIGCSFIISTWKMQTEKEFMSYFFWISVPVNICIIMLTIFMWMSLKVQYQADLTKNIAIETTTLSQNEVINREIHLYSLVILLGFILVLFVTAVAYYTQSNRARSTQLEKAVNQLQLAQVALVQQENLASLGTLTAGIAHEVKNPLNIMKNFADLSIELVSEISAFIENNTHLFKKEDQEGVKNALDTLKQNLIRICEQGKRAGMTVQRMLAHSRDKQEVSETDIHSLLDEYLVLSYHGMRAQNPDFNAKIVKNYDENIPKLNLIAEDISRVFLNIFNNAYYALSLRKKNQGNGFKPELIVSTRKVDNNLEIKIRDNGMGIPEAVRLKIFTPFFTTKPLGLGTGLGLSLSHNLIKEHGGTLNFNSKEGEYTEFVILLPLCKMDLYQTHFQKLSG